MLRLADVGGILDVRIMLGVGLAAMFWVGFVGRLKTVGYLSDAEGEDNDGCVGCGCDGLLL